MPDFRTMFSELGLDQVAGPLESIAQQSIRLTAVEYEESATSRLGGRPHLPPAVRWPVWKQRPLAFVAQIDLAELPPITGLELPRSGTLSFFYNMDGGAYHTKDRGMFRVLYSEETLSTLPRREFPEHLTAEHRFQGVRLAVEGGEVTFPLANDPALDALGLTIDELERYAQFKAQWMDSLPAPRKVLEGEQYGVHRIGGYPDYLQHDPKLQAHLIGIDVYSTLQMKGPDALANFHESKRRYEEARVRYAAGAQDWQLLLLVDSEPSAEILWGDVGQLYYVIRKEHLRERAFENAWMVFDCY